MDSILIGLGVANLVQLTLLKLVYTNYMQNFTFKINDMFSQNPSSMQLMTELWKVILIYFSSCLDLLEQPRQSQYIMLHIVFGAYLF